MNALRPPAHADPVAGSTPFQTAPHELNRDDVERHSTYSSSADEKSRKDGSGVCNVLVVDRDAQEGAKQTEAVVAAWPVWGKWLFAIGLAITAYIYQLDNTTTYLYLATATSSFGHHSLLATVQVAQVIVIAVMKPPIAKLSDVWGRAETYLVVVAFYTIGYIVIASSNNIQTFCGGTVLYAIGGTGIQLLNVILIGDLTPMRWRGIITAILYLPFLINGWVASNIANSILLQSGWRWGYGMFCIVIPVGSSLIIGTLFWGQHRARKQGLIPPRQLPELTPKGLATGLWKFGSAIDFGGVILFSAGISLILLAITLSKTTPGNWNSSSIITMLVIGPLCLLAFIPYEKFVAARPMFPASHLRNRTIAMSCVLGFFDFVGFYMSFTYLYSYLIITRGWDTKDTGYFLYAASMIATVSGIIAGGLMYVFRRYKYLTVAGACIRLLGLGLQIKYRNAEVSTATLVIIQLLQGWGAGWITGTTQVACQFATTHQNLATVTALVLLITEIGGAVGSAIAGAIWTQEMPARLLHYLGPNGTPEQAAALFASIYLPPAVGTPERLAMTLAYDDVLHKIFIIATALSALMIPAALLIKDFRLTDAHNAVEDHKLGETAAVGAQDKGVHDTKQ